MIWRNEITLRHSKGWCTVTGLDDGGPGPVSVGVIVVVPRCWQNII